MSRHRSGGLIAMTTIPETAWILMRGQLRFLAESGFQVQLVSSPGAALQSTSEREGVPAVGIEITRELSPRDDLRSLLRLVRHFRNERPEISMVGTPKAGLLGGLAALVTRVPLRVYVLHGLRLETERGWRRAVLWLAEWAALHAANEVLAVSPSLLDQTRRLHLTRGRSAKVLGRGSCNGIEPSRYEPTPERAVRARRMREDIGIPASATVFGFVGRMVTDKGIAELASAFSALAKARPEVWLLVVGDVDGKPIPESITAVLAQTARVRFTGWIDDTAEIYHVMDALVLPTYREGFPNVCLEAGAAGVPVISTRVTGPVDAVVDGVTGVLCEARDPDSLRRAMESIADDLPRARAMGQEALRHVVTHFEQGLVWRGLLEFLNAERPSTTSPHGQGRFRRQRSNVI